MFRNCVTLGFYKQTLGSFLIPFETAEFVSFPFSHQIYVQF